MSKHSEGPWTVKDGDIFSASGRLIAIVIGDGDGEPPKAVHDRRLLAAAPELLQALQDFLDMYLDMVNSGDCGCWDPEHEYEVIAARAAIRKAAGESA